MGLTASPSLGAQTGVSTITHEYFVQQAADEALLIRINAFEAEFESRLSGQQGELLLHSGLPGSRIAPVFQYVDAPKKPRQLNIGVTSDLYTGRTGFDLEVTRLTVWDNRSSSVSRAYQLLSFGMEVSDGDSRANWTVKIDSLFNAGRLFQQFGMKEMRLWSNYLAAHLILSHLHDHSFVFSLTREALAELKGTPFQAIELATLQLQSLALIGLGKSGSLAVSPSDPEPVQASLARLAGLAESMGLQFEQAWAINASGAEYASGSMYSIALEQFERAAGIADSVGDATLATGIRESIVQVHTQRGDMTASSEVLRKIETQLLEDGDSDELALNLLAQGRLLFSNYQYDQAAEMLLQALKYQNNTAIRKQINFELARVYYESGQLEESMAFLQMAGVEADPGRASRGNSVIDVGEGLRIMANIHRSRGDVGKMRMARAAQGQSTREDAWYLYEKGQDELTASEASRASAYFRQSRDTAVAGGLLDLQHLAALQFCALGGGSDIRQDPCSSDRMRTSYRWLINGGVPRLSVQAMFLRSQILVMNGQHSEALSVLDSLLDELLFLRHSMPGVLGAWYQQQHQQVFDTSLELLVSGSTRHGRPDDLASLLALSKIRHIEKITGSQLKAVNIDSDRLRLLMAQRANSVSGTALTVLNGDINQGLDTLRTAFGEQVSYLSNKGVQKYLRSLGHDEMVLTYHVSANSAQVWVGHRGRVYRREIMNPADLYDALLDARQGLADMGISSFKRKMDVLGQRLVGPVADLLTDTVYWIPAGPLQGLPLDAVRLNGHYLAAQHTVVNLLSFPERPEPGKRLGAGQLQSMFLAGHPQDYSGDYETRLDTSSEIRAVADIYVGPGLHIVQGAALLPDEFQGGFFQQAELVHLSMPGILDLKYPERSSLELSGSEFGPLREGLKPQHIQSQTLGTHLVFLSRTKMINVPPSEFGSHSGLLSTFLDTGADAVIANLWASHGKASEALISDFYRSLKSSGNIADSLQHAKRQYLKANRDNGLYDWAGFQLYID